MSCVSSSRRAFSSASSDFDTALPICSPINVRSATSSARVLVSRPVVHVDNADDFSSGHERHRQQRFIRIFNQSLKVLESRVRCRVSRKGDH